MKDLYFFNNIFAAYFGEGSWHVPSVEEDLAAGWCFILYIQSSRCFAHQDSFIIAKAMDSP